MNVDWFKILVRRLPSRSFTRFVDCLIIPLALHGAVTFQKIEEDDPFPYLKKRWQWHFGLIAGSRTSKTLEKSCDAIRLAYFSLRLHLIPCYPIVSKKKRFFIVTKRFQQTRKDLYAYFHHMGINTWVTYFVQTFWYSKSSTICSRIVDSFRLYWQFASALTLYVLPLRGLSSTPV